MPLDNAAPDRLADLIAKVRKLGADAADAVFIEGTSLSHAQRLGEIEKLERSEGQDLGLRVFVGRRQAIVSSSDQADETLDELAARALAMARAVPEDQYCGVADPDQLATAPPTIDLADPDDVDERQLIDWAAAAEDAARAVDGVTNSQGAEAGWSRSRIALAASNGFAGSYEVTHGSVGVSVLAGEGTAMERDYDFATAVYRSDLPDAAGLGRSAGEKAVRRLGSRKVRSARVPVVYDPRVAGGLLGHLAGAITGTAVARGTSFLRERMGEQIFAPGIAVVDDPHRPRGLRSKPFDAEGVANRRRAVIEDGHLTTWLLDLSSARQLGLESTGHATRGTSGPPAPGPTNLYMEPGPSSPDELIGNLEQGFYVTSLMGFGINMVTGDYSRGAAGFWIENGTITYPVSEVTVAGNLKDMFAALTPASDLEFRYAVNAPTLVVDGMTVAGN